MSKKNLKATLANLDIDKLEKAPLDELKALVELKSLIDNGVFPKKGEVLEEEVTAFEMNELLKVAAFLEELDTPLDEKMAITGLSEAVILTIESDIKEAKLGDIIIYADKLEIKYEQLMPELFDILPKE